MFLLFFKKTKGKKAKNRAGAAMRVRGRTAVRQAAARHQRTALPETAPTYHREGHHVVVGASTGKLRRDFVSSHDAKGA